MGLLISTMTFCTLTYSIPLTDNIKIDVEERTILLKGRFLLLPIKMVNMMGRAIVHRFGNNDFQCFRTSTSVKFIGTEIINYFKNNRMKSNMR